MLRAKTTKVTLFQALIIFHYVILLPISIKKYLIIDWHRRFSCSGQNVPSGQIHFYRANSQNPYKTLWNINIKKYTFHAHPMFYYGSLNNLTGRHRANYRASQGVQGKNDLTPDVSLCFMKMPFFTNHSISSGKL